MAAAAQGVACVATRRGSNGEESRFIYSFPESALPPGVAERFTAMFDHRLHWSFEELEPYIRCVYACVRACLRYPHTSAHILWICGFVHFFHGSSIVLLAPGWLTLTLTLTLILCSSPLLRLLRLLRFALTAGSSVAGPPLQECCLRSTRAVSLETTGSACIGVGERRERQCSELNLSVFHNVGRTQS